MRVILIAQLFPPDMSGSATRAYNIAKGLIRNGCNVVVVAAFPHYPNGNIPREYRWRPIKVEYYEDIKIIRTFIPPLASKGLINRMILFLSFIASSLLAIPFIRKADIVWASNPPILSMIPSLIFGFFNSCRVTLNVDDLWPEGLYDLKLIRKGSLFSRIAEKLAKMAYENAEIITPISPGYIRVINGDYRINKKKIKIVRGGVDIVKFKPTRNEMDKEGKLKVLYSGAFSIAYDFDQVLKTAKVIEESEGGVEFVIQGGGELIEHINSMVRELNLRNVKIINKIISREEVAKLLNTADALILPLRKFDKPYLGISSKLYEYQAVGKPILCCDEGYPAKYVIETKSGIIIKPGDYMALAKAIIYLRENRGIADKMGASGRKYVENNVSIEKIGLKMMTAFKNMCTTR